MHQQKKLPLDSEKGLRNNNTRVITEFTAPHTQPIMAVENVVVDV